MNEKFIAHLRYLMFNDAISTHHMGCNHNAMDRSCVYDTFLDHIVSEDFDEHYEKALRRYYKNRQEFTRYPCYTESIPIDSLSSEEKESLKDYTVLTVDDISTVEIQHSGGFWESLEEIDEYVDERVNEKTILFLLSKIGER